MLSLLLLKFFSMALFSKDNIRVTYNFSINVNIIVVVVGEVYIRVIYRVIIVAITMRIIAWIMIKDLIVMCIKKGLKWYCFSLCSFP